VFNLADRESSGISWETPPAALSLEHDEVHVWRLALDAPHTCLARLWLTLAGDERARAERYFFEQHRQRFIAGRGFMRAILARYLHQQPDSLRFCYGPNGKPSLAADGVLPFNLSHSEDGGLLAVSRSRELGVDLEQVRPRPNLEELAQRFFAPAEVAALAEVAAAEKDLAFYNCWTRKEAFIKASGEGLARPLDQFTVSLRPGEPARLLAVHGDPQEASRWEIRSLTPWPDFVACVALRARGWALRCWDGTVLSTE
jgi:4'-phosphopantetheinyl transferase